MPSSTPTPLLLGVASLVALALLPLDAEAQGWMHWPTTRGVASGHWLTQGYYGDYIGYCGARGACGTHNGYDYGIPSGTPLYAVAPGVVHAVHTSDTRSNAYGRAGKWVTVRHDSSTVPGLNGTYYVGYLHMSEIRVSTGQRVHTQTVLGLSGATGGVAAHLHLHVSRDATFCGSPVDPGCPTSRWVSGSVIPGFSGAPACQSVCEGVTILWAQPARYGNQPWDGADACGDLSYEGFCDGDVLHWCDNNQPNSANCAATNRACGYHNDELGYNCLDCARLGERGPRCEEGRRMSCATGQLVIEDCAAMGRECTPDACLEPPDPCGGLSFEGQCEGDLLRWCDEDQPNAVDCAETGRVCGHHNDELGYNCLDCDRLGEPRCESGRHITCEGGQVVARRCTDGESCDPRMGCILAPNEDAGVTHDAGEGADAANDPDSGDAEADVGDLADARRLDSAAAEDDAEPEADTGAEADAESAPVRSKSGCQAARAGRPTHLAELLAAALGLAVMGLRGRR